MNKQIRRRIAMLILPLLMLNTPLYTMAEGFSDAEDMMRESAEVLYETEAEELWENEDALWNVEIPEEEAIEQAEVPEKANAQLFFAAERLEVYVHAERFKPELFCASDAALQYASSDPAVAVIAEDGTVTVTGTGSTTLRVFCEETEEFAAGEAFCELTVLPLRIPEPAFEQDEIYKMITAGAFVNPLTVEYDGTLTYNSSDVSVAVVNAEGLVKIMGEGCCRITAAGAETGTCTAFEASYILHVDEDGLKDLVVSAEDVEQIYNGKLSALDLIRVEDAPQDMVVYYSLEEELTGENLAQASTQPPEFDQLGDYTIYYYAAAPACTPVSGHVRLTLLVHDLSDVEPVLAYTSTPYTGKEKHPIVTLLDGMKKNRDFTVEYRNNVEIGRSTVIIKGIGNYTGETKAYFKIVKKPQPIRGVEKVYTSVYTPGMTITLQANSKAGGKIVYTSLNTAIATVGRNTGIVKVKKPGKVQIRIDAMPVGYYAKTSKTINLRIMPDKPVISQLASNYEGIISVGLSQPSSGDGFVVQFSKNKDFKGIYSTGSTDMSTLVVSKFGLKSGTTYYIRARIYANTEGGRIWSDWSDVSNMLVK